MKKYSESIDNTDFIWHYHDIKKGWRWRDLKRFRWQNNGTVPYFITDVNVAGWEDSNNVTNILFAAPRSYVKYKHFANSVFDVWKANKNDFENATNGLFQPSNRRFIRDYLEYRETMENQPNLSHVDWNNKQINKALFAGSPTNMVK